MSGWIVLTLSVAVFAVTITLMFVLALVTINGEPE